MFCLNWLEWLDLGCQRMPSRAQHSDIGIYSHYWNDCWHVLLNKTRVDRALMWGKWRWADESSWWRLTLFLFIFFCNYGLSFFTLYFHSAVVFSFFPFFFFSEGKKKQNEHAAGLNAMFELRIVNTKPCNLQNAFVIFTSNFSFSTEWVPHMKSGNQKEAVECVRVKMNTKMNDSLICVTATHFTPSSHHLYVKFVPGGILICSSEYKMKI